MPFKPPWNHGPREFEWPFAYDNLVPGNVLDIGKSHDSFHEKLLSEDRDVTILDVRRIPKWDPRITYIREDIRNVRPSLLGRWDNIVMVSTLEHVGLDAYGQREEEKVINFERSSLQADANPQVGQQVQLQTSDGRAVAAVVSDVSESTVTVDANHPLAGKDLIFDLELMEIV